MLTLKDVNVEGYTIHHIAWARGYVSRKYLGDDREVKPYRGRFGKGYVVLSPSFTSTRFHKIVYLIKED